MATIESPKAQLFITTPRLNQIRQPAFFSNEKIFSHRLLRRFQDQSKPLSRNKTVQVGKVRVKHPYLRIDYIIFS